MLLKFEGIDWSRELVSLENLFKTRPLGFVSKKYMGARSMLFNIELWIFLDAERPPEAKVKLDIKTKILEMHPRAPYTPK